MLRGPQELKVSMQSVHYVTKHVQTRLKQLEFEPRIYSAYHLNNTYEACVYLNCLVFSV